MAGSRTPRMACPSSTAAGLKMLQTLVSLRKSVGLDVSRAGVFRSPAPEAMASVTKLVSTLADEIVRSGA